MNERETRVRVSEAIGMNSGDALKDRSRVRLVISNIRKTLTGQKNGSLHYINRTDNFMRLLLPSLGVLTHFCEKPKLPLKFGNILSNTLHSTLNSFGRESYPYFP